MKKLLFISLFAALIAAGCSKDEGPGGQGPKIPGNEIWYTSANGNIVKPDRANFGGAEIVSNTYENGKGIIKFNAPVTEIGTDAFYSCRSLTSVTIPDSVTEIGRSAFRECSSLTAFYGKFASADNRCLIIDGVLNSFAPAGLTEYTIPDSVTTIGEYAFRECSSLTSVTIPDSVTEIGSSAFYSCGSLTSVIIGNSVTKIGDWAFAYCSGLTSVTIPDSVTTIGQSAFFYCSSLTAFYGKFASEDNRCWIVDGVLKSFAPAGLTEYTIPDSVTTIGDDAFVYCSSLTSVTIPDSVTTIENFAFAYCSSLTNVYCRATTPPTLEDYVFKYYDNGYKILENLTAIYVPRASVEAYKAAKYWSDYADLIRPYDF